MQNEDAWTEADLEWCWWLMTAHVKKDKSPNAAYEIIRVRTLLPFSMPEEKDRVHLKMLYMAMKLMAVLLTVTCLTASARGNGQGININVKNAPLDQVFAKVEDQGQYYFTYTREVLQGTSKVTLNLSNATIYQLMDLCVKGQPISYEIIDKAVIIKAKKAARLLPDVDAINNMEASPPINIHGRVLNEKGEPVEGVTVTVKNTRTITVTNANGEFYLKNIDPAAVLLFTSISMEAFELEVKGKAEFTINLQTKVTKLSSVEVKSIGTGYQNISRERFVGSAVVVDSALFHRQISTDVLSRLNGLLPSVLFNSVSGNFTIRGISALSPSSNFSPLIILDDFPYEGDINNINPNDVQDISILRDAAAASIWGSRAGNGVVVIRTKKGQYNQPLNVAYSYNITVRQKPNLFYIPRITTSDFIDVEKFLFDKGFYNTDLANTNTPPVISPVVEVLDKQRRGIVSASQADAMINSLRSLDVRNDYNRYVYRNAVNQQHYLNFNGGTNQLRYAFSLGYDHNLGNIQGPGKFDRYTINSTNTYKPTRFLELTAGLQLAQDNTVANAAEAGSIIVGGGKSGIYPYAQLADAYGNPLVIEKDYRNIYTDTVGGGKLLDWKYRPLQEIQLYDNKAVTRYMGLNIGTNARITSWLNADVKLMYWQQLDQSRNNQPLQSYAVRSLINRYTQINGSTVSYGIPLGGILGLANDESHGYNLRGQLNYNRRFKQHQVTALAAVEVKETNAASNTSQLYGYDDVIGTYNSFVNYATVYPLFGGGSGQIGNGNTYTDGLVTRFASLLANLSYSFREKYTLYASGRRDGANAFGVKTNARWKPLWSVGLGWNISKESFFTTNLLSYLKLRLSYGYTGNVPGIRSSIASVGYYSSATSFGFNFGVPGEPPIPDLRWEQVGIINVGIDFSSKSGRVSGSVEWFQKYCTDLIAQTPFDPTLGIWGVTTLTRNVADLKGSGFDITLNTANLRGPLSWNTSFNFSHVKNIVKKYFTNSVQTPVSGGINPHEGEMAYGLYSYRWAGLDASTGDPRGYLGKTISTNYQAIFQDSFQNQVLHGSTVPLYFGNVLNSFSWKGFSLSFNIVFRFDYYFRKPTINYYSLFTAWGNAHTDYYRRWQKPGDELFTNVPSMVYPANSNRDKFYALSEVNAEKADNIRLQDLRIGLPAWQNIHGKNHVFKSAQFFFYPSRINWLLWKANDAGIDPDYVNNAPPSPSWALGLSLQL